MSSPIRSHADVSAVQLASGEVLLAGGGSGQTDVFEPSTNTWSPAATMILPRFEPLVAGLPDGRVLGSGGCASPVNLDSAEVYDPSARVWSFTSNMLVNLCQHRAALLSTGDLLVTGGTTAFPQASHVSALSQLFNSTTGSWRFTGTMHFPRTRHSLTALADGRVLAVGGCCTGPSTAEIYDPTTGVWTPTASMRTEHVDHSAALLQDGRVLVAGGVPASAYGTPDTNGTATAEVFDPATGAWTLTGSMNVARRAFTLTRLASGDVLAAAGCCDAGSSLASAELYHPATGTWSVTANLAEQRTGAAASLLRDGRVLVAGGRLVGICGCVQSSEIFAPSSAASSALLLDGASAYASVADAPDLNLTGNWTVETWFKDDDPRGFNHDHRQLLTKGDRAANAEVPYYVLIGHNNLIAGVRSGGVDTPISWNLAYLGLDPHAWHHVAVTFNASLNVLNLWLDGTHIAYQTVPTHAVTGNHGALEIGRAGGSSTPGKYWKGQLDDVRIWNIARRGTDISATFRSPIAGRPAGLVANWRFDEPSGATASDSIGGHTAQLLGGATRIPDSL